MTVARRLSANGTVQKTVEVGAPIAALKVVITNGGTDVGGQGTFEVRPAGNHGADIIAYEQSGGTVRVPAGTYDVDVGSRTAPSIRRSGSTAWRCPVCPKNR